MELERDRDPGRSLSETQTSPQFVGEGIKYDLEIPIIGMCLSFLQEIEELTETERPVLTKLVFLNRN